MLAWKEGLGGRARAQLEGRRTAWRCSLSNISSDCFWIIRALCEPHKTSNQPERGKHIFSSHSTAISMGGSNFMKSTRLRHPSPVGQEQNSVFHLTPQISQKKKPLLLLFFYSKMLQRSNAAYDTPSTATHPNGEFQGCLPSICVRGACAIKCWIALILCQLWVYFGTSQASLVFILSPAALLCFNSVLESTKHRCEASQYSWSEIGISKSTSCP